jgi:hypothetical protein
MTILHFRNYFVETLSSPADRCEKKVLVASKKAIDQKQGGHEMFKKALLIPVCFLGILLLGCTDPAKNPVSNNESSGGMSVHGLSKISCNTSAVLGWQYYCYRDQMDTSRHYCKSYENVSFNFNNYNYSMNYSNNVGSGGGTHTNTVVVKIGNTTCAQIVWYNTDGTENSRWLGWTSFTYNNISMQVNIYVQEHYIPMHTWSEPRNVQLRVYSYVAPDAPSGFAATPKLPQSTSANVTLTWNASSDADVTGYKIYRKLYTESAYTLKQTIKSRTTSSWVDSNIPWNDPGMPQVKYEITAVDATHGFESGYAMATSTLASWAR